MKPTLYQLFGLPPGASVERLHARFLELSRKYHPDVPGGDTDKMAELSIAWAVLKNHDQRRQYDAKLRLERTPCPKCDGRGVIFVNKSFTRREEVLCKRCEGTGQAERHHD